MTVPYRNDLCTMLDCSKEGIAKIPGNSHPVGENVSSTKNDINNHQRSPGTFICFVHNETYCQL